MEKIYLDTFVFMDLLSDNPEFARKALAYLQRIKSGECGGVISSILFAELAFHIRRRHDAEKAEEIVYCIESLPNVSVIRVDGEIAKSAGMIRAHYMKRIPKKLTYFDCIHLATAIREGCVKFVTGDKGFRDIKEIAVEIY